MGVTKTNSTPPGAWTPICDKCGIALCWDISEQEYNEDSEFWDAWICEDCNGGVKMSLRGWKKKKSKKF